MSTVPNAAMSDAGIADASTTMTFDQVKQSHGSSSASTYPAERKQLVSPSPPPLPARPQSETRSTIHTGRTMFVRHQDAGMLRSGVDEVIDLPPLYTDVARS